MPAMWPAVILGGPMYRQIAHVGVLGFSNSGQLASPSAQDEPWRVHWRRECLSDRCPATEGRFFACEQPTAPARTRSASVTHPPPHVQGPSWGEFERHAPRCRLLAPLRQPFSARVQLRPPWRICTPGRLSLSMGGNTAGPQPRRRSAASPPVRGLAVGPRPRPPHFSWSNAALQKGHALLEPVIPNVFSSQNRVYYFFQLGHLKRLANGCLEPMLPVIRHHRIV
jgi:hypothetical protein